MNKRALLIAYHFPPQAESSGVQRMLSFSRHLQSHGWEPLVLSANPRAYGSRNDSLLALLPPQLIVKRAFALDTKRHLGIFGRYPEFLALPDRWISWLLSAVPVGLWMIRKYRPAVIVSTYPIPTALLIGLLLQWLTGLPWVADFRDPMLQDDYPTSPRQRRIYRWLERQAIFRCRRAIFTTGGTLEFYRQRYPAHLHEKFVVIENGYDEEAFSRLLANAPSAQRTARNHLTLLHSGALYAADRDPSAFFQAISLLKAQGKVDSQSLRITLRGTGDDTYFRNMTDTCGVADIVTIAPPIPYYSALQEMLNADALLVFQGATVNTQIPAKIYEYFRARKPILGLVDSAGETAKCLSAAGFQCLVALDDAQAISSALDSFLLHVRCRTAHVAGDDIVAASCRKQRSAELARIFEQLETESND
jgi:glycosyltransferase involved in cell wall biosynthesis